MITIQKAILIAQKELPDYEADEVIDLDNKWGVSFYSGEIPVPDVPTVTVEKANGNVGFLTVPPLETIEILEKATVAWSIEDEN